MKLAPAVLAALAVIVALVVAKECGYREGAKQAEAAQRDAWLDSVAWAQRETADSAGRVFDRERDSTSRVIASLRSRIAKGVIPTESPNQPSTTHGGAVARGASDSGCAGAPAQCDSLIAAYEAGRQSDSLQLLFWKAQVVARDSLVTRLQQARDAWRKQAQRRLACVGGASVAVGLNGQGAVGPGVTCGWRF